MINMFIVAYRWYLGGLLLINKSLGLNICSMVLIISKKICDRHTCLFACIVIIITQSKKSVMAFKLTYHSKTKRKYIHLCYSYLVVAVRSVHSYTCMFHTTSGLQELPYTLCWREILNSNPLVLVQNQREPVSFLQIILHGIDIPSPFQLQRCDISECGEGVGVWII